MNIRSEASAGEGVILVMCCWCTVLAAGLVAPVLPAMRATFATNSHVDLLIGLVAAAPALMVALLALPMGTVADRVSPRTMLLAGLALYGMAGLMPLFLGSLGGIIASRAAAGVGEGATMIASTALIARRFEGARRQRWLAFQVLAANMLGIAVVLLGGRLGLAGWRLPFVGYVFGLVMLIPTFVLVRDPPKVTTSATRHHSGPWPWPQVIGFCLLNLVVTIAIFSIILQLPFLLVERGAPDSFAIGLGIAAGAAGLTAGAAASARLASHGWRARALAGLVIAAVGFLAIGLSQSLIMTGAATALAGVGAGLTLPALLAAFIATVPQDSVGRAVGYWTVANFAGQFAAPPTVLALALIRGRSTAYGLLGLACFLALFFMAYFNRRK